MGNPRKLEICMYTVYSQILCEIRMCDPNYLGHVDIIELLLDYGSSVMAPDNYGSTPLHLACQKGHQRATVSYCHFTQ